jgi:hypothetical protein
MIELFITIFVLLIILAILYYIAGLLGLPDNIRVLMLLIVLLIFAMWLLRGGGLAL